MDETSAARQTVMIKNFRPAVWQRIRREARERRWDTAALIEAMAQAWWDERCREAAS